MDTEEELSLDEERFVALVEVYEAAWQFAGYYVGARRKDPHFVAMAAALEEVHKLMSGPGRFICPECGGCFFGCVNPLHGPDEEMIYRCHGDSSLGCRSCDWQGPFKFGGVDG